MTSTLRPKKQEGEHIFFSRPFGSLARKQQGKHNIVTTNKDQPIERRCSPSSSSYCTHHSMLRSLLTCSADGDATLLAASHASILGVKWLVMARMLVKSEASRVAAGCDCVPARMCRLAAKPRKEATRFYKDERQINKNTRFHSNKPQRPGQSWPTNPFRRGYQRSSPPG